MSDIIAIDFSLGSPGICIGNSADPDFLQMGCFRQRKSDESLVKNITIMEGPGKCPTDEERYFRIASELYQFIVTHTTSKIVYIEGYSFGSTGRAIFNIAEATATLKQMLWQDNYQIISVPPTTIKKSATGKGNSNKTEMYDHFVDGTGYDFNKSFYGPQKPVEKGMKIIPSPFNDIVDAYWLLQFALKMS